ncbi:MAG: hypothetical protein WAL36_07235, partial [Pseudolabrys sp.]
EARIGAAKSNFWRVFLVKAAGGKGMNHRSRRKGIADWAMDGSCQAGNYRNAREGGGGENDSLAHIRQPLIRREQPTPYAY